MLNLEKNRIEFLLKRDGLKETMAWASQTIMVYRISINDPKSHASKPKYKPSFEQSIFELEHWLWVMILEERFIYRESDKKPVGIIGNGEFK